MIKVTRSSVTRFLLASILLLALLVFSSGGAFGQAGAVEVGHNQSIEYQTNSDIFRDSAVDGTYSWWLSIHNPKGSILKAPGVEVLTRFSPDSFEGMSPQPDKQTQKGSDYAYTWNLADLPQEKEMGIWLGGKSPVTFTPGFDSRRDVTPVVLSSEVTSQKVAIRVTPQKSLDRIYVDVYLEESPGISASFVQASFLPKDVWIYRDGKGISWTIQKPDLKRDYELSCTLELRNTFYPEKVSYKPRVLVQGLEEAPENAGFLGSSVTVKDRILGTTTYSAAGKHEWQYHYQSMKSIVHRAAYGAPFVSVTVENPQTLTVVSKTIAISAFAGASAGVILSMHCRMNGGEWIPMNLGNETQRMLLGRTGSVDWDTTKVADGPHDITIKAEDSNGITDNKTITVIVDNSGPRFVGYSQIINFVYVVAIVIGIVGLVWIGDRKRR